TLPVVLGAGALFLGLALHAAGAVTGERARQTLDSLLTTPLPTLTILADKALACLVSTRGAWWCLTAALLVVVRAGLSVWPAVLLLLLAAMVFAAFATVVGLWLSAR